ncbi:MAG: PrsW family intramembrane metalloprotease [Bacilli bacterium]|nr:PrsW family intramembrane metalloprotease [Bacilli bacterium]
MYILGQNPILIIAAVLPAIILAVRVYQVDRLEKEPTGFLVGLLFLGIFSTGCALVTEILGDKLLNIWFSDTSVPYRILEYFVVVACSEEGFKYLLLNKRTWKSPNFNCQFDGVVYAVFVSLGFALWENISYVVSYGFETALIRAVTAVPGHACFGVFMGICYGIAKKYSNIGNEKKSKLWRILGFVVPVIMHGSYDYIATIDNVHYAWIFVVFVIAMFAIAFYLVKRMSKEDTYI